jgi:hypothetical protein
MTVTFDSLEIPNPSKIDEEYPVVCNEEILESCKRSVQSSTEYGYHATFTALGTYAEALAFLAKIGTKGTLSVNGTEHTNCCISAPLGIKETDNPGEFFFRLSFVRETV